MQKNVHELHMYNHQFVDDHCITDPSQFDLLLSKKMQKIKFGSKLKIRGLTGPETLHTIDSQMLVGSPIIMGFCLSFIK